MFFAQLSHRLWATLKYEGSFGEPGLAFAFFPVVLRYSKEHAKCADIGLKPPDLLIIVVISDFLARIVVLF